MLGVTALVVPIAYDRVIQSSVLILLAAMAGVAVMFYDGTLEPSMELFARSLTGYSPIKSARAGDESGRSNEEKPDVKRALWVGVGGVLLPLSARLSCGERRESPVTWGERYHWFNDCGVGHELPACGFSCRGLKGRA